MPLTGLLLLYEWTFFIFTLLYGWYLDAIFTWGKTSQRSSITASGPLQYDSVKGIAYDYHILFILTIMLLLNTMNLLYSNLYETDVFELQWNTFLFSFHHPGNRHLTSWDDQTVLYSVGMASLAILAPGLPLLFGVTALFSRYVIIYIEVN